MKYTLTFFLSLITGFLFSQRTDYVSPLDIPLLLSGNFGELRTSHFHAGVDFKTQGKEGLNIYAVKEGYVSRIGVGAYGYGKVLYITHPDGNTTVYAHLQKFSPTIEEYVKKRQYARKSFEIEAYPKSIELPIKKGEIIGYGGNTGSSGGPHLHFEIRDSSAKPLNPLLFGYEITDRIPPDLYQVVGYALGEDAQIDQSQLPRQINATKQQDGTYLTDKIFASGLIGFGVQSIDKQDFTNHVCGLYKATMRVNGSPYFQYIFDKLDFSESRYINVFTDYVAFIEKKSRIQLLYKTPGNRITTFYTLTKNNGYIDIQEGMSYLVTIDLQDIKGNTTQVTIPIEGKKQEIKEPRPVEIGKKVIAQRDQQFSFDGGNVYFPENTFYEDFSIQIESLNDTLYLHNPKVAVHKNFELNLTNKKFADNELSKVFIAYLNEKNRPSAEKTTYKNGVFSTRTRNLGRFTLMKDTVPPVLRAVNFKNNANVTASTLKVEIKDDLSGVASYSASLNGEWVLFEYDPKTRMLTFDFSDIDTQKTEEYKLEMTAKDGVGNTQKLEVSFTRKKTNTTKK